MKRIFCFISVFALLITLTGCSEKKEFRDDYGCAKLLDAAAAELPQDLGYKELGGEHIKYNFDATELDDDHAFLSSVDSSNINEFGIFHAPTEAARRELLDLTEDYLEDYLEEKEAFIASYAPGELEKLKNAEARTFGNYVAYAILSKEDKEIFFDTVEKLLRK